MSENEYKSACQKFKEKFGDWIIDRVEMSLVKDYKDILEQNPKLVLDRMMKIVYQHYVLPFEISKETSSILSEEFNISDWKLVLTEKYEFQSMKEYEKLGKVIESFYSLVNKSGINLSFDTNIKKK